MEAIGCYGNSELLKSFCSIIQDGRHLKILQTTSPPKQKKGKRKVQGVPQLQTAVLPRYQEEEETDKTKQAQIEQTSKKH